MPQRIQRKRTKGWKAPEGAVYVGRPTRWGNPFRLGIFAESMTRADAVIAYRRWVSKATSGWYSMVVDELRGKDLMCWCPLDQPCHADVLLELANPQTHKGRQP